jgi:hypothetical protein
MDEISYFPSSIPVPFGASITHIGGVKVKKGSAFLRSNYDNGG